MASRHSFLAPVSPSSDQQSARQLVVESCTALVNLESVLKQRNQALEQHIEQQEEEKTKEKENFEQTLQNERCHFASKREYFWGEINEARRDLVRKNEAMDQLKRRLAAQQRTCDEERQRSDTLVQQNRDLHAHLTDIVNKNALELAEAKTKQAQLQRNAEHMERTLREQNTIFEQERARWQQGTCARSSGQPMVKSSLEWVMPHLRGLLEAYDREQGSASTNSQPTSESQAQPTTAVVTTDLTQNEDVARHLGQQDARNHAQLLEQERDAARTQHDISQRNLTERERVLTCPISLELFDDPVVTECCGKTFSSGDLRQALQRNSRCPFCRGSRVAFHQNRDLAKLVELHRTERSILGLPELPAPAHVNTATEERRPHTSSGRTHDRHASSGRTRRHRHHRSERVQARSNLAHRQPIRPHGQASEDPGSLHQSNSSRNAYSTRPRATSSATPRDANDRSSFLTLLAQRSRASRDLFTNLQRAMVRDSNRPLRDPRSHQHASTSRHRRQSLDSYMHDHHQLERDVSYLSTEELGSSSGTSSRLTRPRLNSSTSSSDSD
ncbi:hypothetical protein PHMEG_00019539 [Phytophthora megakarya]|uniref:SP-RING-type domain-containing protein n=1 Tax=Phytophthora megakarya TaxID=4795 RepID=A0A225VRN0_9STRA|nr:hypothetical protein PHMEG_00019539 [Phytophthora megakarya]